MDNKKVLKSLIGGGKQSQENIELMKQIEELTKQLKAKDELLTKQEQIIASLPEKKVRTKKDLIFYNIKNINSFLKTQEYENYLVNPEIFQYDEGITAFDKNLAKNPKYFYPYQKQFIQDWSVSQQELCILYYGVGTGKTLIAVNCAEQFVDIYNDSYVYFITPASLVFVIINNMFKSGIDPTRKNKSGEYVYNFMSYQQLLNSKLDFKPNSLLIIDEIHNLRNFRTQAIYNKISARKYEKSDNFSIVGTKLGQELLQSSNKFLRSIFMTGTLFVNSIYDIEPIISLGYKKTPLYEKDVFELDMINNDMDRMKLYYSGLLSFYRRPSDTPNFPNTKYKFELLKATKQDIKEEKEDMDEEDDKDAYFIRTRNQYNQTKIRWIMNFLLKNKKEKTLIYVQFVDRFINGLVEQLNENKIKYGLITGQLNRNEKQQIVNDYNDDKIKVLIFTLSIKEGISFKETNNFIMTQPYWNYAITEQIIARGIRSDSHKKGNKSTVNVYLLVGTSEIDDKQKTYLKYYENIMNKDIKTYKPKYSKDEEGKITTFTEENEIYKSISKPSRDIDLYHRMIEKQGSINIFEKKLLFDVKRFEEVNNLENNEFVKDYNKQIIKLEKKQKKSLTNKQKQMLKSSLYDQYYKKSIEQVNKSIIRFDKDTKFQKLRNPDLIQQATNEIYADSIDKIKTMLSKKKTLNEILESFKIPKQEITTFQANFTPESEVDELIKFSGIENDKRQKIFVLEPTMGIGNIISKLLKLKNNENLNINGVELHNLFYQIAMAQFQDIQTVKLYNMDFLKYLQKFNYDYIIGNPPFNLRTQLDFVQREKVDGKFVKKIVKYDITVYDIDFVAKSYNMLNNDGILCMIISDRFLRSKLSRFKRFRQEIESIKDKAEIKKLNVSFKKDKTITKEMETSFGMVYIKLQKKQNHFIPYIGQTGSKQELGEEIIKEKKKKINLKEKLEDKKPRRRD
jgi:superfamily II DNA or RNA helicase